STLSATSRPSRSSRARHTTPMPPRPICSCSRYRRATIVSALSIMGLRPVGGPDSSGGYSSLVRRMSRASSVVGHSRGCGRPARTTMLEHLRNEEERAHMAATEPGKIRNVAVVGHRGTGKSSLVEALLFQTGEVNRLGTIEAGTTISDSDEDEQKRQLSIALSLAHTEWQGRKINLLDCPGDPSFQGEARCALRVVEGALVVVSGVMGFEVVTARMKKLAEDLGLARVLVVNMLDRERADFFRALGQIQAQFSSQCADVPVQIRLEHELTGIVDVLHMSAYMSPDGQMESDPVAIPDSMTELAQEYR